MNLYRYWLLNFLIQFDCGIFRYFKVSEFTLINSHSLTTSFWIPFEVLNYESRSNLAWFETQSWLVRAMVLKSKFFTGLLMGFLPLRFSFQLMSLYFSETISQTLESSQFWPARAKVLKYWFLISGLMVSLPLKVSFKPQILYFDETMNLIWVWNQS